MHGNGAYLLSGELCVVRLYEVSYALNVHCFIPREFYEKIIQLLYYSTFTLHRSQLPKLSTVNEDVMDLTVLKFGNWKNVRRSVGEGT
jgi:hypothetical protein